jgi:hypothetical protein
MLAFCECGAFRPEVMVDVFTRYVTFVSGCQFSERFVGVRG